MNNENILKVLKGAAIASGAVALTYISQGLAGIDFGASGPLVVGVLSVLINATRKWLEEKQA